MRQQARATAARPQQKRHDARSGPTLPPPAGQTVQEPEELPGGSLPLQLLGLLFQRHIPVGKVKAAVMRCHTHVCCVMSTWPYRDPPPVHACCTLQLRTPCTAARAARKLSCCSHALGASSATPQCPAPGGALQLGGGQLFEPRGPLPADGCILPDRLCRVHLATHDWEWRGAAVHALAARGVALQKDADAATQAAEGLNGR